MIFLHNLPPVIILPMIKENAINPYTPNIALNIRSIASE